MTDPSVVPLCLQLGDFLLSLQKLLPTHIEFLRERSKLLESDKHKKD